MPVSKSYSTKITIKMLAFEHEQNKVEGIFKRTSLRELVDISLLLWFCSEALIAENIFEVILSKLINWED